MARQVPPGMRMCPYCAEDVRAEAIKCRYCGERLEPVTESAAAPALPATETPSSPPVLPAPPQPVALKPPPAAPEPAEPQAPRPEPSASAPEARVGFAPGHMPKEIYRDSFDLDTMTPSVRAEAMRQQLTEFPVWLAVILSIVTFNVFFAVYYSIKHGKLPRLVGNDPGGLAAFGLLFVPFFNVYWVFFMWTRLADRLNFQLLLAGEEPRVKRAVPIVALTLLMIGILSAGASPDLMLFIWSLNWLVLVPIFVADMQGAINVLARMRAAAQG